jgi:hypothetical protein
MAQDESYPVAVVKMVDGELVLEDPQAAAMIRAINKVNCKGSLEENGDRVEHFKRRMGELNQTPEECVIVILSVDDPHGAEIADILMPDHDWQQYRDRGEKPIARGLAGREFIQSALEIFDQEAAMKLKDMKDMVPVVVVDFMVAEVFGY